MLKPNKVHVQWVDDEAVVLNEETGELHYLNTESALVYALLLEYGMPAALEEAMSRVQDPPTNLREELEKLVASFIDKGILVEG